MRRFGTTSRCQGTSAQRMPIVGQGATSLPSTIASTLFSIKLHGSSQDSWRVFRTLSLLPRRVFLNGMAFLNGVPQWRSSMAATQEVAAYLDMGFFVSVAGGICREKNGKLLRDAVSLPESPQVFLPTLRNSEGFVCTRYSES